MNVTFFDIEDKANHLNGTIIRDGDRLSQVLEGVRMRAPFFCELIGENGYELLIGVGPEGCVQFGQRDGNSAYLVAVSPDQVAKGGQIEFLCNGLPTPVPRRYCMPFDSIREIAGYFLDTGRMHPTFAWEEI
jgi:hypothetical protein